jgi:myosin heavy subunit
MATARRKPQERAESNYVKFLCYRSSGFKLSDVDKTFVWIPVEDERCYIQTEVQKDDNAKFSVRDEKGQVKEYIKNEKNYLGVNPPKFDGVDDMAELGHLNEPAVLYNMTKRYDVDLFHTYSGLFLVIVNPYKRLPVYTDELIQTYVGRRRDQIAPHVFALADTAYRAMLQDRQDQSMLITGESGAGKTENTKKVIQYLASIAGRAQDGGTLEQQLLEFNPILEAFGNAKTTKNNNSSRFGKFIELQFNAGGQIAGANTLIYLLEKSRVVFQAKDERNFHIFYQLIAGATPEEKSKLHLTRCEDFHFVNQSGAITVKGTDDGKEFEHSCRAFDILNISEDDRWAIWEVISGILHLGNLPFIEDGKESAALKDDKALLSVSELLGVDSKQLKEALLRPMIEVGTGERVVKGMNLEKVTASRDSLAKSLYQRLFVWVVTKINEVLSHPEKKSLFIGVLDISGFEIFTHNSFEQLCINFTNEKLQQFFNHHMFTLEQKEYETEQIEWSFIDFGMDSQDTIDLIEKPPNGILTILDEQTNFPDATDTTFTRRLHRTNGSHRSFRKPRFEADTFKILHYAGEVEYETKDWLEKNRDPLEPDLEKCLKTSKHGFVQALFKEGLLPKMGKVEVSTVPAEAPKQVETGAKGKTVQQLSGKANKSTIWITFATQHKEQLNHLMTTLRRTNPHFIRCILPNMQQRPGQINNKVVLDQLKCNGVLEGIRITRKGFPNRIKYAEYLKRYHLLKPGFGAISPRPKDSVKELMDYLAKSHPAEVKLDQIRYGLTKIFFRTGQLPAIERLREKLIAAMISSIQAATRAFLARRLYDKLREQTAAARIIQRNLRAWLELRDWPWWQLYVRARPLRVQRNAQKELEDLKAKVAELEDLLAAATKERDLYKKQKEEAEANAKRLAQQVQELEQQLLDLKDAKEELEADLKVLTKKCEGLQEEIDDEILTTKELEGEKKRLEERVLELNNKIEDAEKRRRALEDDKTKVEAEREEWKVKYSDAKAAGDAARAKVEELERKVLDMEDAKYEAEGIGDTLRQKLRNAEENATRLKGELEEESKKAKDFEAGKKKFEFETERLQKLLDESNRDKESLTNQIRKLTSDLTASQSDLASERGRADKLEKQQKSLKQRVREIEEAAETAAELQANQAKSKGLFEVKLEELQDQLKDSESDRKQLNSRLSAAKSEADEANRLLEEADAAVKRWEAEAKSRAQDITDLETELEVEREAGRQTKKKLMAKIQELTLQAEGLVPGTGASAGDLKTLQEELTRVRDELVLSRDGKQTAEKALSITTIERDDYKTQFEAADAKSQKLLKENRRLQNELDEVKDQYQTAQGARDILSKSNNEMLSEIATLKNQLSTVLATGGRASFDAAASSRDNRKLKEENESLERRLRVMDVELRDLRPALEDTKYLLEAEKVNSSKLTTALQESKKTLMERELANARLIAQVNENHTQEQSHLLAEISSLKLKNEELTEKCAKLSSDFEMLYNRMSAKSPITKG